MALTCIIVDDDPDVIEQLTEYITELPELHLIKSYINPLQALKEISLSQSQTDILFTDIEMPALSGLELAKKLRDKFTWLVIVSGYQQYAIDGYQINANNFLTKPFNLKKLKSIITALNLHAVRQKPSIFIKLKDSKEIVKIFLEEIVYIEADGNYIRLNTSNAIFTTLLKLSEIEEKLQVHKHFVRIHKSFIISTLHLEKLQDNFVFLTNNKSLSVTATYKDLLLNQLI